MESSYLIKEPGIIYSICNFIQFWVKFFIKNCDNNEYYNRIQYIIANSKFTTSVFMFFEFLTNNRIIKLESHTLPHSLTPLTHTTKKFDK